MQKLILALLILAGTVHAQSLIVISGSKTVAPPSTVATPTFSPAGGTYSITQTVTISTTTPLAVLCYTTDGSTPTEVSNLCSGGTTSTYSTPISVATTQTVKAIGTLATYTDSAVGSAAYTISASCTPPAGATYDYDVNNSGNYCTSGTTACTNGLGIYELQDSIASNTATQATGANQPIYTTGAINGLPAAVFTAASIEYLQLGTQIPTTNQWQTAYIVFSVPTTANTMFIGGDYDDLLSTNAGNCYAGGFQAPIPGGGPYCSTSLIAANTWYAIGFQWNTSTGDYAFDRFSAGGTTSWGSGTAPSGAPLYSTFKYIGYYYNAIAYMNGSIARVIYYDSALPTSGLAAYTSCKYGL
jgi:hypothetical protein